jgi:disulfide bond formation protein DsbB
MDTLQSSTKFLYGAFVVALVATLGSLAFSEILHLPPCVLCWYQRILMYPLVIILGVGILRKDTKVYMYVLPLSILGLAIALYHSLIQWGIIPDTLSPCTLGVSCTTRQINLLGFITIPFMSLVTFTLITISTWFSHQSGSGRTNETGQGY